MFDDDEENPPVGFEQDPEEDELGHGTWIYADGSRKYSKGDPEDAKKLIAQAPQAQTLGMDRTDQENSPIEPIGAKPNTERDELEPMAAAPEASEEPKGFRMPEAKPLEAPKLPGRGGPAKYSDTAQSSDRASSSESATNSTSTQKSAQSEGDFKAQQGQTAGSYQQAMGGAVSNAFQQASATQQRAQQLQQMGADREAVTAGAMAQRDQRANQVKTKIGEVSARKTDMNKIWKDKGALGTTLGLLGVALRSLNSTKFGGPNTALQSIQEQRKQNIQAQMEDRDSELRGLEKELGSLDAAVPMLEARMRDAESKRLEAMMLDEKSQSTLANGRQMLDQLRVERDKFLGDSAKAYYGTIAQQQSQQGQVSREQGVTQGTERMSGAGVGESAGKTREQVYDGLLERDKKMEERGIPKEERAAMWKEYGFNAPSGDSAPESMNREQREKVARDEAAYSEDQAKAESAYASLGQYGESFGLKRDKAGRLVAPDGIAGFQSPAYQEKIPGAVGLETPIGDARAAAVEGIGRLQSGGVISPDEAERFLTMLGDDDITRKQLASKLNSLETLVNTRRKANRRDAPKGIPQAWKSKPEGDNP